MTAIAFILRLWRSYTKLVNKPLTEEDQLFMITW